MGRIQLSSIGPGVSVRPQGGVLVLAGNQDGTITLHADGTPIPVYPSEVGGSADASGNFTTDSFGHVPGWIDDSYADQAIDITVPPAATITAYPGGALPPSAALVSRPNEWSADQTMHAIDFWDGTRAPVVEMVDDYQGWGWGSIGIYSIGANHNATPNRPDEDPHNAYLTLYDHTWDVVDSTSAAPTAPYTQITGGSLRVCDGLDRAAGVHVVVDSTNPTVASSYFGLIGMGRGAGAPPANTIPCWQVEDGSGAGVPMACFYDGSLRWGPDSNLGGDTTLIRAAAGVLQIPQHGGGLKLTSPDGTQTKQIQLSNAGALVVV